MIAFPGTFLSAAAPESFHSSMREIIINCKYSMKCRLQQLLTSDLLFDPLCGCVGGIYVDNLLTF